MTNEELKALCANPCEWTLHDVSSEVPALLAEIERLRGLIKAAEWSGYHETPRGDEGVCPWCDVEFYTRPEGEHAIACPAFTESGDVR